MTERLMRVSEVAERLNLTPKTVYLLTESGRLDHFRIRRTVRVSPSQLEKFLEQSRIPVRPPVELKP